MGSYLATNVFFCLRGERSFAQGIPSDKDIHGA